MAYGLIDLAKDAVTGNIVYASEEVQRKRMETCVGCIYFNSTLKICEQCGCYMVAKVKYAPSTCPQDKW